MGAGCSCGRSPGGPDGEGEDVKRGPPHQANGAASGAPPPPLPPRLLATAASRNGSSAATSPRSYYDQASPTYMSAVDGHGGGYSSADEEEWHDALSEVDLAEALAEWEEEAHFRDASIDDAIVVLKAHGHLLPPDLEAAAAQQRSAERDAARLHAAAVPPAEAARKPPTLLELGRSRSQQLRVALEEPQARKLLASAANLAAQGRVLAAHALASQAAELAGGSLAELAALPEEALAPALAAEGKLPAGGSASLDVARLAEEAEFVDKALAALDDHSGWMVSRNDKLKVFYKHQKGTTVHSLKFCATFDHPLEHLLAIAHEFDLIVTWNKFSLASLKLAEPSIYESYVYGAQWMMKPFKPMQGLLRARGFDLADEHRCLLISLADCAPETLPAGHAPLPKEFPKRKLVNFLPGSCVKLRPLPAGPNGQPRTEGALLIHLDPHIPFIPAFLLNFVLGVLSPYVYNQMVRVLDTAFADPSGAYPSRIRDQPHLYGLVRARLAEFDAELSPRHTAQEEAAGAGGPAGGGSAKRSPSGGRRRRQAAAAASV